MTTKRLLQLVTNTFMVFLVAFALVGTASAQDQWYVNSTEGDDLNDGSQMDNAGAGVGPFETLAQALLVADDDDTIIVLAGDYTGEDLETSGLEDLTFQVQASGLTTVATFDNLVMTENASLSGGNGSFSVENVEIVEVTLTLGANLLQIRDGSTVTLNSDVDVASVVGSNVVLVGSADYYYTSDDDNDIVAGFELPADGDLGEGEMYLGASDDWSGGSMTFPMDLTMDYLYVEDEMDVVFQGNVAFDDDGGDGYAEFYGDGSVTFEGTVTADDGIDIYDYRVVTFEMAANFVGDLFLVQNASATFESTMDAGSVDVEASAELTIEGAASVDDGNFNVGTDGDVEVASLNLNEFNLVQDGGGSFTATGTVTIGDDEVAAVRIDNSGVSEMTLANVVLENVDGTGDDGTAGNADETLEMTISNTGVGSELYLGGTITEKTIVDDDNGDEDIDYVVGIINGDGALFTFGATTSFSGDVDNGADLAAPADEGIAIADGVSIISAWPNAYTDLGAWGDGGTLEISEGIAALATIVEVGNFILSADRDITSDPFISTGDVTLEADDATDVVVTDVQIDGTLYIVGDAITMDGGGAPDTYVLGGLVVTASGAGDEFTVGDGDDDLTIEGGASIIDAVINADITVDGDFSSNGADIEGDFENEGGDSEFDDTTVGGNVIADGDVTIEGDVAFGDVGLGMDDADVTGTLTINGVLTLTNNGADFEIGTLWMDVPDAELYADGMDFTISRDATTSLWDSPGNVEFTIDNNGAATFHPAPNTTVDSFNIDGSDAVLTIAQGFASTNDVYVGNDATLALGINTITIGGDLTLVDEAMVTTDTASGLGAIAFNGGTPEILLEGDPSSTPTLSNIRVNGGASLEVTEADPGNDTLGITGDLSLNDGTFTIPAGVTVNMTGDAATITRNPSTGTLVATGPLTGEWDLVYFGGTGATTGELAGGQVKDLTVNMTDGNTLIVDIDAEILGNLHVEDGKWVQDGVDIEVGGNFTNGEDLDLFDVDSGWLMVAGDFTITEPETADDDFASVDYLAVGGSLSVPTDVVLGGGDVHLTGDGTTHNNEGDIESDIYVDAVSVTIVGSTNDEDPDSGVFEDFYLTNGASVTGTDIQETDDWFIDDSSADLMFVDGDDTAIIDNFALSGTSTLVTGGSTANPDGIEVDDVEIYGESSWTINADFEVYSLFLANDDADVIVLDLMGNTISFYQDGFYVTEDADVTVTDGTIHVQDGADTVFDLYGLVLPNVTIEDASDDIEVTSDFEVSGLLSVLDGADFDVTGGVTITLSGDAFFEDGVVFNDGEFETTGTTITLDGNVDFNDLTISSSSTTQFVADDGNGLWNITVNNDFTMESGVLDITDEDLLIEGGDFDYNVATGDAIVMNNGEVYFDNTDWSSDGVVVTLANIGTNGTIDMANGDGDGLLVTGNANLDAGAQFDMNVAAPGVDATVEFAGGSSIIVSETGALDIFELDPTLGMGMSVVYDGGAGTTTGNELAATVANLETDGTDLTLDDDATVLVTGELRIDGDVQFDVSAEDNSLTLGDGGLVVYHDAAGYSDDPLILEGDWNVEFDGLVATDDGVWPNATVAPLAMTVSDDVAMHEPRTTVDLNVDAELDVDAPATLTVTGNLFADDDASFITSATGFISMGGTELQMLTFDADAGTPDALEIDNAAGVTLDGSDLDFSAGGTLILTDGPLNTGDDMVILAHGGTGTQGYTRTNGVINGNVQKQVDTSGSNPNRIEFPTGTADGNYRPFAITFNDPVGDIGDLNVGALVPDVFLTVSYDGVSAMGTNGLPITTTDSEGNDLSIGRYPDFHWNVSSSPTVSPSVDYDVEFQAEGYDNFAQEDIERTRAIRRQDGATTNFWILTSPVAGDNDNYAVTSTEPVAVGRSAVGAITGNGVLFTFGLEQNMVATNPATQLVNADATKVVDLSAVFSGGDGNYTYAVTSADAATATGVGAGTTLTISGVAVGSTTLTVVATDGFGDTATATVTVEVGAAFAATEVFADFGVNSGAADTTHDGAAATSGGTAPYTYAIASSDATVVAAAIDATSGLVTLTYGVLGTSTITISTTDATGATVDHSFDVTVNVALGANGALADVSVEEGAEADVDASAEFTGGTGDYTYTAASASDANATVAVDGSTVTVTGVSAYTVVAGEVTGDAAPVTVTVTATDEFGGTMTSTFDADVTPVLGNVDGSGGPSPAGASAVLDHFLGLSTLTAKQQTAADFNMDTAITPFDAALIFDAFFNGKDEIVANPVVDFNYGEVAREENIINIPVMLTGDLDEVVSASFSTRIDPAMATIVGVTSDLADGWIIKHVIGEDGTINLAFAGNGTLDAEGTIATISIELNNANVQFNLGGEGAANNNTTMSIDAVEVAELPETFALHGNYPNPFNPSTSINFDLPESADVEIQVIDMIGRQVMTLPATTIAAGANRTVQIDASRLASGPYFYRVIAKMESKTLVETGRMMLVK